MGERVKGLFVGRSTLDIVYACASLPEPDGKIDAHTSYMNGGGPALNAAVAFAGLGGHSRLGSVLGAGFFANQVRQDVGAYGVEIFDAAEGVRDALPVSSIILSDAARAIVSQPLPASTPMPFGLLDRICDRPTDIVLSDGHLPELAVPVLRWAREMGIPTVLDGGSWKPWTPEILPWIDIAIVSSRFKTPGAGDARQVLSALGETIGVVAMTNGAEPILWSTGDACGEVRPPKVEAIDTLGAGDVFHGAFCHAFVSGADFTSSLASAAELAARSCTAWGPRRWLDRAEAEGEGRPVRLSV